MRTYVWISALLFILCSGLPAQQQFTGDVLGTHNLSPTGTSPVKGGSSAACLYCHAPHSGIGGITPLWSQTLSSQTYNLYSASSGGNLGIQPVLGTASTLCLSCHDGTVSVGQLVPYGNLGVTGTMSSSDVLGVDLKSSHPFSLRTPLKDASHLVATLTTTGKTADPQGKVALVGGTVECNSCHEPHAQNLDPVSLKFLVRDAANGQLCLACHESSARTVNGKTNPLTGWPISVHATSVNNVAGAARLGSYATVTQFACLSCHMPHNANGSEALLRGAAPPSSTIDPATGTCVTCHGGTANLQQPIANVYAEFAKMNAHPAPAGNNTHDPAEPAVLINNRHATCADCHNAHSSSQVLAFPPPPAIRGTQGAIAGVSAADGTTPLTPAANQYENCLRCHGSSPGKQSLQIYGYMPFRAASAGDPLNVIREFAASSTSSHPVMHSSTSPWPQPSLLPYMLDLDGNTSSPRMLGATQADSILCTDCHNADDNREFGGGGPSGPHGSQFPHILERRYDFSQVGAGSAPGTPIQNLNISPNLNVGGANPGPYALCGKCHDLSNVLSDASFKPSLTGKGGHFSHVSEQGLSCSACHTAHGMASAAAGITGERLVNFDLKVVAPNGTSPVTYNHPTNTCTLLCHGWYHNPSGTVTTAPGP